MFSFHKRDFFSIVVIDRLISKDENGKHFIFVQVEELDGAKARAKRVQTVETFWFENGKQHNQHVNNKTKRGNNLRQRGKVGRRKISERENKKKKYMMFRGCRESAFIKLREESSRKK